ncbi:hypothetical protein LOTGIDRAFT_153383 [Lottia gigantea]|uniref:Uncharacterized protein n=1 Tax=Lottia gigantea TaxID=225164 RepID=V4AAV8_LOTGI|nr:hypothetical protein LOTGIDRAFT_153383 [Lottia gigantea]ESO93912.1 hypothetical protein LOTGIDRAFT_153383 [Lottia gigantea]
MSADKTRWRSHVGLPSSVIQDATSAAKNRGERIPRAIDSNVKPKIIYVSRNHSVRNDSYKSELIIPKRSTSHESVVSKGVVEIPLREKLAIVENGNNAGNRGFKPIRPISVSSTTSSIQELPELLPPLVSPKTPPSSANSSPPPPPVPTSSPPPLDDQELPPPPSPTLTSLPPKAPSPTPSFHGNHIKVPKYSPHEDEILRYLDQSIAKENIIISESSQSILDPNRVKGDNSSDHIEGDTFLITKWDGKNAKTVRAYIKPGTVEELRELFQKLGQSYNKSSALERKKMRRFLTKKRRSEISVQNYDFFHQDELPLIKSGIRKTDSNQSDISATTTASNDSSVSTLSERESSSSKETNDVSTYYGNIAQVDSILPIENSLDPVTNDYNMPSYSLNSDYTSTTTESHTQQVLSSANIDKSNSLNTNLNNDPFKSGDELKGLNHAQNTYLGQPLIGVTSNHNESKGLADSYSNVWTSSNDMNMSKKSAEESNEWYAEDVPPVLSSNDTAYTKDQRLFENITSVKSKMIDVNIDSKLSEQDKPDETTRTSTVSNTQIRRRSSVSSSRSNDSADEEIKSFHGSKTFEYNNLDENENRAMSPKEKYENLLSELKIKTSVRRGHVTEADSKTHSRTSSAKFSYNSLDDSSGDDQTYDVQEAEKPKPKEQFDNILSEFKSLFGKKSDTVPLSSQKSDIADIGDGIGSSVIEDSINFVPEPVKEDINKQSFDSVVETKRQDSTSSFESKESVIERGKQTLFVPSASDYLYASVVKRSKLDNLSDSDDEESVISGIRSIYETNSQQDANEVNRRISEFSKPTDSRRSSITTTSTISQVGLESSPSKENFSSSSQRTDLKAYFQNLLDKPSDTQSRPTSKTFETNSETLSSVTNASHFDPETTLTRGESTESINDHFVLRQTYPESRKQSLFPEGIDEPPPEDSVVLLAPTENITVSSSKSVLVGGNKERAPSNLYKKDDDSDLEESEEWKSKRTSVLQETKPPSSESDSEQKASSDSEEDDRVRQNTGGLRKTSISSISSKSDKDNTLDAQRRDSVSSQSDKSDAEETSYHVSQTARKESVSSTFSHSNFEEKQIIGEKEETTSDNMPVLSGFDDNNVTTYDLSTLDLSNIGNIKRMASNRSDRSDRATSSRSSHSMRSSSSSVGGFGGTKMGGELVMVEGANGDVYVVEDVTDSTKQQETFSSRSSSSGSRVQSGSYQIGSTGNVRIDSKVDDATANQVISALYGLNGENNAMIVGDSNNNEVDQRSVSLRSSGSTSGSLNFGMISLPGSVSSRVENDDNNVTQDVKEHETVTIHGVTDDNVALIEHRIQKTITKHKDVEESGQSVTSSLDNELSVDTDSTDYSVIGYKQRSTSYAQPILVTTQQVPIDLSNSAMRTYNSSAVIVPPDNTVISTYNIGNLTTPATSTLNYNTNSAFQAYNPMMATTSNSISTISDKYVGTTTEYTLGENNQIQTQTNYVKSVEPTATSYQEVQGLLNDIDKPKQREENVTTVSVRKDDSKKHEEAKDNETNYYSKTTTTTTIIPPHEVDSVYGSKSSRTTSEESPRDDDAHLYRIVRASMSPRRSQSPKRRTIYHEVAPRRRSPSPIRRSRYHDIERPSRSDVFRSERLDRSGYKTSINRDYDFIDDGRKVKVVKTYASTDDLNKRRKSSGFVSSDSESDRNVTRVQVRDHSYPSHNYRSNNKHGYESDDEMRKLYRIRNHRSSNECEPYRSESVMSDDQLYRANRYASSLYSPSRSHYLSSSNIRESRSPSPEYNRQYRVIHSGPTDSFKSSYQKSKSFSTSRLDSGYFEPEYSTRTKRMIPSKARTTLSPTRNSTIINLNRNDSGVTSPTRSESLYKVVNVKTSDDTMRKSRRRKSKSPSDNSDSGDDGRRFRVSSSRSDVTSRIKENGINTSDSKRFVQRSFSPTPVDESYRLSRGKSVSQEPIFRTRSPSPYGKYKTTVDVRREYTDKLSRSLSDVRQEPDEKSYVVYNTRSTERQRSPKRKEPEIFMTDRSFSPDRNFRMRTLSPTRGDISYRSFTNDLPNGFGPPNGLPNGDVVTHSTYERTAKSYKIDNEPQLVDSSESKDLKVVRGQILIKNKIDTSKDDDDFDDNVNVFDNFFHLQKDNPLYQSDPDIYKSFEEESKKQSMSDDLNINQDITFETVERIAKKHEKNQQGRHIPLSDGNHIIQKTGFSPERPSEQKALRFTMALNNFSDSAYSNQAAGACFRYHDR